MASNPSLPYQRRIVGQTDPQMLTRSIAVVVQGTRYTMNTRAVHIIEAGLMCEGSGLGGFLGGLVKCQSSLGLPCASLRLSRDELRPLL